MKTIYKTRKFDINLINPYATLYTAVAENKDEVKKMLQAELSKENEYNIEEFEIEDCGKAIDQMGNYFDKEIKAEM